MLKLHRILSFLRRPFRRRSKSPTTVRQFPSTHPPKPPIPPSTIRIATFNAAMFSISPVNNKTLTLTLTTPDPPKSIIKPQQTSRGSNRRVSINLPGAEQISDDKLVPKTKSLILDVLRSVEADVFSLQNVRAEEEKGMNPLSDLAAGLGMKYVFAESWSPEFGNAILSKWPIKRSWVQKICDDEDFRNVLKVTIEVPGAGEVNLHCTNLDHLNEEWRMKQITAILGSSEEPHILAAGLNALDETDYSVKRWNEIVKCNEQDGKPRPRADVMRFMNEKKYMDAKDFAGESTEAVVVVAEGQGAQGTCKQGTRVDYILASPGSPYKFVPGSYAVISSKGTSDHHIVKVDIVKDTETEQNHRMQKPKQRLVKIERGSTTGIWKLSS